MFGKRSQSESELVGDNDSDDKRPFEEYQKRLPRDFSPPVDLILNPHPPNSGNQTSLESMGWGLSPCVASGILYVKCAEHQTESITQEARASFVLCFLNEQVGFSLVFLL